MDARTSTMCFYAALLLFLSKDSSLYAGAKFSILPDRTLLCPVCQHGWMVASPDGLRLVCSCGARLNLGEDQISLEQIQAELAATFDEHRAHARDAAGMSEGSEGGNSSAHACERPVFTVQNNFFGVSALLANCEHCGFCRVVI